MKKEKSRQRGQAGLDVCRNGKKASVEGEEGRSQIMQGLESHEKTNKQTKTPEILFFLK